MVALVVWVGIAHTWAPPWAHICPPIFFQAKRVQVRVRKLWEEFYRLDFLRDSQAREVQQQKRGLYEKEFVVVLRAQVAHQRAEEEQRARELAEKPPEETLAEVL